MLAANVTVSHSSKMQDQGSATTQMSSLFHGYHHSLHDQMKYGLKPWISQLFKSLISYFNLKVGMDTQPYPLHDDVYVS